MAQCDNWADNEDNYVETPVKLYDLTPSANYCGMVAEEEVLYQRKK